MLQDLALPSIHWRSFRHLKSSEMVQQQELIGNELGDLCRALVHSGYHHANDVLQIVDNAHAKMWLPEFQLEFV